MPSLLSMFWWSHQSKRLTKCYLFPTKDSSFSVFDSIKFLLTNIVWEAFSSFIVLFSSSRRFHNCGWSSAWWRRRFAGDLYYFVPRHFFLCDGQCRLLRSLLVPIQSPYNSSQFLLDEEGCEWQDIFLLRIYLLWISSLGRASRPFCFDMTVLVLMIYCVSTISRLHPHCHSSSILCCLRDNDGLTTSIDLYGALI